MPRDLACCPAPQSCQCMSRSLVVHVPEAQPALAWLPPPLQDLAVGLGSRPVWDPASSTTLPPLRSAAWLPVPGSLAGLRGGAGRRAAPSPLGLPLSLLSMGDQPGSCTLFSTGAGEEWASDDEADAASADSVEPVMGPGDAWRSGGSASTAGAFRMDLSVKLWGLQEAELAQHALLALQVQPLPVVPSALPRCCLRRPFAPGWHTGWLQFASFRHTPRPTLLQGVTASHHRLQALLATPDALPRRSVAALLHRLAAASELRQRLQCFVAAFTSGGAAAQAAHGGAAGSPCRDSVQRAFAVAVAEVLRRQSSVLQQLEQQQSTPWVQAAAVGGTQGCQLHSRAPTLLRVALHSGRLQLQLRRLAELCWCTDGSVVGGLHDAASSRGHGEGGLDSAWRWQDGGFPTGTELLNYLYGHASEAGKRRPCKVEGGRTSRPTACWAVLASHNCILCHSHHAPGCANLHAFCVFRPAPKPLADSADAPMLRFLFVQALQPYLRHLHSWAFTSKASRCAGAAVVAFSGTLCWAAWPGCLLSPPCLLAGLPPANAAGGQSRAALRSAAASLVHGSMC